MSVPARYSLGACNPAISWPLSPSVGAAEENAQLSRFYDVPRPSHERILQSMNETTDATAIFAPLWKRKWLILAVGIVVAAATYVYYKHQPRIYGATTEVYLGLAPKCSR